MSRISKRARVDHEADVQDESDSVDESEEEPTRKKKTMTSPSVQHVSKSAEKSTRGKRQEETSGTAAICGVLKSITLKNFMCHSHFSTTYHPKMNFIHGNNGSGKSALLTGITVALGGRAALTGRAGGLKDLIKSGQDQGSVAVVLANAGSDAFEHKTYGDEITVERTFHRAGGGGYKIFNSSKKVVSTRRDDLNKILDHMNIQIDNPMNVLTQDNARSFIADSDPKTKYQWFLRGTQLDQLVKTYDETEVRLRVSESKLEASKKNLPALEERVRKYSARVAQCQRAQGLNGEIDRVEGRLLWAHVNEAEAYIADATQKMDRDLEKAAGHRERADQISANIEDLKTVIAEEEERINEFKETKAPLKAKKQKLSQERLKILDNMDKIKEARDGCRLEISVAERAMKDVQKAIDAQNKLLSPEAMEERAAKQLTLDKSKDLLLKCRQGIDAEITLQREAEARVNDAFAEQENQRAIAQQASNDLNAEKRSVGALQNQLGNRLNAFGRDLGRLQHEIDRTQWRGPKPIGPLGMYLGLKDFRSAKAIQSALNTTLLQYAAQTQDDRIKLMSIITRMTNNKQIEFYGSSGFPGVITHNGRSFDYSRGDLSNSGPTILSILNFTDDHVRDILITKAHIERTFVLPTRDEAVKFLDQFGPGTAVTGDDYQIQRKGDSMYFSPQPHWSGGQLFVRDASQAIQEAQDNVHHLESKLAECRVAFDQAADHHKRMIADQSFCNNRVKRIEITLQELGSKIARMEDDLVEGQSVEVDELAGTLDEYRTTIELQQKQLESIDKQMANQQVDLEGADRDLDETTKRIRDFNLELAAKSEALGSPTEQLLKDQATLKHSQKSCASYEAQADAKRAEIQELENDLQRRLAVAEGSPRPDEHLDKDKLLLELRKLQKQLQKANEDTGINLEEATRHLKAAADELHGKEQDNEMLEAVLATLRRGLLSRRLKFQVFRGMISINARTSFLNTLARRGQDGQLEIDHGLGTLRILVTEQQQVQHEVDDAGEAVEPRQAMYKSTKSLSGGERSFATISLLLALWDAAGCPIRCLDEFDVFMDQVNRDLTMKILMGAATASEDKQFILITPQDINLGSNADVKVIKVRDPQRNQGVLSFGAA